MKLDKMGQRSPEKEPSKKFKVGIEMEGYGKNGDEIEGSDLWEEVVVEADSEDEAIDIIFNQMDFGNRIPNGYSEIEEINTPKT